MILPSNPEADPVSQRKLNHRPGLCNHRLSHRLFLLAKGSKPDVRYLDYRPKYFSFTSGFPPAQERFPQWQEDQEWLTWEPVGV